MIIQTLAKTRPMKTELENHPRLLHSIMFTWNSQAFTPDQLHCWLLGVNSALWSLDDPAHEEVDWLLEVLERSNPARIF